MGVYLNFQQLPRHLNFSQHNCGGGGQDCRVEINRAWYTVPLFRRRGGDKDALLTTAEHNDTAEPTRLLARDQIHTGQDTKTDRNVRVPQMHPVRREPSVGDWLEFQGHRFMQQDLPTQVIIVLLVFVLLKIVFTI
ncbi:hypothetical protein C5167_030127 [Papaver somniferum]|nr:hypothetical protein C5167_030127 [Papaver somniferum]